MDNGMTEDSVENRFAVRKRKLKVGLIPKNCGKIRNFVVHDAGIETQEKTRDIFISYLPGVCYHTCPLN